MELLIPVVTLLVTLSVLVAVVFPGTATPDHEVRNTDLRRPA